MPWRIEQSIRGPVSSISSLSVERVDEALSALKRSGNPDGYVIERVGVQDRLPSDRQFKHDYPTALRHPACEGFPVAQRARSRPASPTGYQFRQDDPVEPNLYGVEPAGK
jgi:hypothetical protein